MRERERLVLLEVFRGNIIFGDFVRFDFPLIRVRSIFDAADNLGLVSLSLFGQFRDTL
jgi:hypothetical protein